MPGKPRLQLSDDAVGSPTPRNRCVIVDGDDPRDLFECELGICRFGALQLDGDLLMAADGEGPHRRIRYPINRERSRIAPSKRSGWPSVGPKPKVAAASSETVRREPIERCASWWLDAVKGSSSAEASRVRSLKRSVARDLCQDLDVRELISTLDWLRVETTATALADGDGGLAAVFGLSVPQYSCLEILDARPGISNRT